VKRAVLHLEFATPAFLGGASSSAPAEWRSASIRGQWRWWFRALAGTALENDPNAVAAAEKRIFGSTGGRSLLQIRAVSDHLKICPVGYKLDLPKRTASAIATAWDVGPGHRDHESTVSRLRLEGHRGEISTNTVAYLAYGCMDHQGTLDRSCLAPGSRVMMIIQWHPKAWSALDSPLQQLAGRSLKAWLLLGGIGSKCRKGFGSLRLAGEVEDELPTGFGAFSALSSPGDLKAAHAELLSGEAIDDPKWTQLSTSSRICPGPTVGSWEEALDRAGGWLIAFRRRYGIRTDERTGLQDRDYEWHKGRWIGLGIPDRAGFGLPLPFKKHGPEVTAASGTSALRRASPLLIHVQQLGPSDYIPVFARPGGAFLPDGAEVHFSGRPVTQTSKPPTPQQLDIVDRFLDDLSAKKLITPV
jgi:CRISPR type III-B/RAMP module RAMP protein Cmr1